MYIKNLKKARSKSLVFTSAGENNNILRWCKDKEFDLFIAFYGGNSQQSLIECSDYFVEIKGGKFPNLKKCFDFDRGVFEQYDSIFVADDDIEISGKEITKLFDYREKWDFNVLQPSFDPVGKVSHQITKMNVRSNFRITNFVEVTCPLFEAKTLFGFLDIYDPVLVGWGVDYWFCDYIKKIENSKIGIVDNIVCINPHDITKSNGREIELLQKGSERAKVWNEVKRKYNLRIDKSQITISKNESNEFVLIFWKALIVVRFQFLRILRKLKMAKI